MNNNPLVSIIIPTNKEDELIFEVISEIFKQDYKNKELIIIWDNPEKKAFADKMNKKFNKKIRLLKNKNNLGLAESLNEGVRNSKGEIIVALLDDCVPVSTKWLSNLIRPFSDKGVVGVGDGVDAIRLVLRGILQRVSGIGHGL